MKSAWYTKKWVIFLAHAAVWTFLFCLPLIIGPSTRNNNKPNSPEPSHSIFILHYAIQNLVYIGFFYLNAYVLIPQLTYSKKYWQYGVCLLVSYAFILTINGVSYYNLIGADRFNIRGHILIHFFFFLFFIAASTAYQLVRDRMKMDRIAKEKETENLKTELSLLRSQVSPHFMFNVLNNMVALARKKSDLLEPSLIKLSSLMRYMLYETDDQKVPLEKEIEYLQSYIDLQKQRFGNNVKINTAFGANGAYHEIEPMLLIPFVENAFKHGTGIINSPEIDVDLKTDKNMLNFSVRNKYNGTSVETRDKTSGIGLPNVKRRLNLLYGKNHSLLVTQKDEWFVVSLQLYMH